MEYVWKFILTVVLCQIWQNFSTNGELFSAISDIETFLQVEQRIVKDLYSVVRKETKRLKTIKKYVNLYKNTINDGLRKGVSNPVDIYILLKNVHKIWNQIELLTLGHHESLDIFSDIELRRSHNFVHVPTEEDLNQTLIALANLHSMYNLKKENLIFGKIKNNSGNANNNSLLVLDAQDCYQMGEIFYNQRNYADSADWFLQSLNLYDKEEGAQPDDLKLNKIRTLTFLSNALYKLGKLEEAINCLKKLLEISPNEDNFLKQMQTFEDKLQTGKSMENLKNIEIPQWEEHYKSMCNNELVYTKEEKKKNGKLFCYYQKNKGFLRLAPLKVELLHLRPDIILFKNVISNKEIETIKTLAKPKLRRALVKGSNGGSEATKDRIAKTGWLKTEEDVILELLNKRLEDMTNLDMRFSEDLQIGNYGIGGFYSTHMDAFKKFKSGIDDIASDLQGDRIATVMFYLSTPEEGGATVFPMLNVTLFPSMNDAVVWYNLLRNGEPDMRMQHSGCPVLAGSKWVANKWIRERGQEFHRMCTLNEYE